jgi:enoyl-CoA hydratase/carnithine racemase
MQALPKIGLRRLEANFCYFKKLLNRNFCETSKIQNNTLNGSINKNEKKPFESVLYHQHSNHVIEIVLNEPKKLNSIDSKMVKSMLRRVKRWVPEREASTTDEEVSNNEMQESKKNIIPKVVIMSGAGGKSFCAGGDISSLYHMKKNGESDQTLKDFFRYEYMLDYLLSRMRPIQVVLWNGYVMGGGVGLSINAPIRVATDNSLFAMPGM